MFRDGVRVHQWTSKNLLPTSGKLIPEFDRRRNIRDMFSKKPSLPTSQSSNSTFANGDSVEETLLFMSKSSEITAEQSKQSQRKVAAPSTQARNSPPRDSAATKRSQKETSLPVAKRTKSASQPSTAAENKGQKSLKGFFQPKTMPRSAPQSDGLDGIDEDNVTVSALEKHEILEAVTAVDETANDAPPPSPVRSQQSNGDSIVDPIVSRESWGRLFIKPAAPKCEHEEPCKTMLTKKTGINCGRSFWMCARPLGPSGNKEKGTQWRCSTFIWASDWSGAG